MKIAVASGKGGTGKSTVSTNLAYMLSNFYEDVALLDCDVEEPNCHIFLKPNFDRSCSVTSWHNIPPLSYLYPMTFNICS